MVARPAAGSLRAGRRMTMPTTEGGDAPIRLGSLTKGLALLSAIACAGRPVTLPEAAALAGTDRSTARRMPRTLRALRIVRQDEADQGVLPFGDHAADGVARGSRHGAGLSFRRLHPHAGRAVDRAATGSRRDRSAADVPARLNQADPARPKAVAPACRRPGPAARGTRMPLRRCQPMADACQPVTIARDGRAVARRAA